MIRWNQVKLEDICTKITVGHVGSMADSYVESGIPFLRSLNIKPFRLDFDNLKYIDEIFHTKLKKSSLKPNDIFVVRTGYPGTAWVIPFTLKDSNCSDLVIIRPSAALNPHFLAAIFNSSFGQSVVSGNLVGAAQQHFNVNVVKQLKFWIPDRKIQDKIVAILSAYDELIENNRRRIALLERMAEEIYREWFVRMRFPGHEHVKVHKGVPEGWKEGKLGSIVHLVMGQSPKSEYYNQHGDGLPFNQGVGTYGERFPRREIYCSIDGRRANKGDILFSVRAPVGRLNIADCDMIIGRGLAGLSHKQGFQSYLYYLLKCLFSNEDIIGNGAIFNSVGRDELSAFGLLKPTNILVEQFNKIALPIDQQIMILSSTLSNLQQTRDLLLSRLIAGKLAVDDLDIHFPPGMAAEP